MPEVSKIRKGGVTYDIKDEYARTHSGGGTAATTTYDNTKTGLSATNVQDAIDEMVDVNLYETVVLTVGSADSSFSPVGQTITVTLEDGATSTYTVPSSLQITFTVQRNIRYSISGTSTGDYRALPLSVKAAIPVRYLTMHYVPVATGVFILQSDGNYYLRDEYDAETMADDAVGVLVLTSALINAGYGFVLKKSQTQKSYAHISWNDKTKPQDYSSLTLLDALMLTERYVTLGWYTPCVDAVKGYITVNGNNYKGCVATYAVGGILHDNRNEITRCMSLIGGVALADTTRLRTCTGTSDCYSWSRSLIAGTCPSLPIYQYPLS